MIFEIESEIVISPNLVIDVLAFICSVITVIISVIIVYDRLKNDKISPMVQIIYELIETLLFSFNCGQYIRSFYEVNENSIEKQLYKSFEQVFLNKIKILKKILAKNYTDGPKYIGLIKVAVRKTHEFYSLNSVKLSFMGELLNMDNSPIIKNHSRVDKEHCVEYQIFTMSLRNYWKRHYYKLTHRRKLKSKINYFDLLYLSIILTKPSIIECATRLQNSLIRYVKNFTFKDIYKNCLKMIENEDKIKEKVIKNFSGKLSLKKSEKQILDDLNLGGHYGKKYLHSN